MGSHAPIRRVQLGPGSDQMTPRVLITGCNTLYCGWVTVSHNHWV